MITVILPFYNAESVIHTSINSILRQTYKDFKLLLINDGSTDSSQSIINRLNDDRICCIKLRKNVGLVEALNLGLNESKSKYIIRMDSDDVAAPERFRKQLDFMEQNPDIGISGTACQTFGKRKRRLWNPLSDDKEIKTQMLFKNPMIHPTIIMRSEVIRSNSLQYRIENAEDYGLWWDASQCTRLANISKVLLNYRVSKDSFTNSRTHAQKKHALSTIYHEMLKKHVCGLKSSDVENHYDLAQCQPFRNIAKIKVLECWIQRLINSFSGKDFINLELLENCCFDLLFKTILKSPLKENKYALITKLDSFKSLSLRSKLKCLRRFFLSSTI